MNTFDRDFFVQAGRKGGNKTKEKHGTSHFSKIASKKHITKTETS